ncbi:MAG: DUF255 domain-containing protein, partial [Planctomycetota bacterium]
MNYKLSAILVLGIFILFSCTGEKEKTVIVEDNQTAEIAVSWLQNLSEGIETAKASKKPLMVDFTASWCTWCKKLDKEVFVNHEVAELSGSFVNVKVDTDKYPEDARRYGVQGRPARVLV